MAENYSNNRSNLMYIIKKGKAIMATGTTDYMKADDHTIADADFSIDFSIPIGTIDFSKTAPVDGQWHTVNIQRRLGETSVHGAEYIDGVLFRFVKFYDSDGNLQAANFTRGDLCKGIKGYASDAKASPESKYEGTELDPTSPFPA